MSELKYTLILVILINFYFSSLFLFVCLSFPMQQTQNICITFIQRQPNVFDAGPILYKCYTNVLCLLGLTATLYPVTLL